MKQGLGLACYLLSACFAMLSVIMMLGYFLERGPQGLILTLAGAGITVVLFFGGAYLRASTKSGGNTE